MRLILFLWWIAMWVGIGELCRACLDAEAFGAPGQYCTSTRACGSHELCVTRDPWASAGTCERLKLLP